MKPITPRGWVTLAFVVLAAVGLTGCGGGASWDLSTPEKARQIPCTQVSDAIAAVNDLLDEDAPGKRNSAARKLNLDPDNKGQTEQMLGALKERAETCKEEDTPPAEPSESANPTETPTSSTEPMPSSIVGWDNIVENPPNGLEDSITAHEATIGFNFDDVNTWAKTKLPSGDFVDARIVLVFNKPELSEADARRKASISKPVPVLHVKACQDVAGEGCSSGKAVRVVLAPLNLEDGKVTSLRVGAGVVLTEGFPLITFTR